MTKDRSLPAMILTAGLGTRLRPLTEVRAKPAMPVAGEPLVRRLMRWLAGQGIVDVVLNLHHLPATICSVVGDGSDLGVRARCVWEQPRVLGSAGGPRQALDTIGARTFLLVNGDTLTDLDLSPLIDAHMTSGASVTMAIVPHVAPHRYGGVRLDRQGRVTGFVAKDHAEGSYHFIGIQVVNADVFADIPGGEPAGSIGGVYDAMIASRPGSVRGVICETAFWDVGTVADYWSTSWAFADREGAGGISSGRGVILAPGVRVSRSILWDDVAVGPDAMVEDCVVTDGVRIPAGARYRRQILLRGQDDSVRVEPLTL